MFRLSSVLVWRKLLILGLISLILCAIPTLLYVRQANKEIDVVKQELRGLEPAAKLLSVLQHTQMHRGLSSAILGGNASFAEQRAAREKDTTAALATFREAMPAKASTIIQTLDKVEVEWKSLSSAVKDRSYSAEDSYNRHTKLLADLLRVLELTVDYYGLTLDPENQSHFLIVASYTELPRLAEALDQMRARGTSMLTFKQATGEDRVLMASLIEKSRERIDSSKAQMQKVFDANDALKTRLDPALSAAQTDAHKFVAVSDLEFVRIEMLRYDAGEYLTLATSAIDFQFKLITANAVELEQLLQSRLSEYRMNMVLLLALVGTVLLGSALLTWRITRSIVLPLSMAVKNAESIAEGRLDTRINVSGHDELGKLLRAMGRMQANLGRMVFGIRETSESVASASREIAGSTQDISARTEEQASSLEETSASMEEMNSTVRQNDNNSQHASELAMQASDVAHQGGAAVGKMAKTMVDIETSSKKIADIIGVIDSIAFQTNILALNAAVEAARAGEQGRGFAVVAAEVRTLAQRSGQAAKEIRALIADSVQKVGVGAKDAAAAGKTMESVVASIKRVADAMSEIRIASQEQLQGIAQVTRAVEQMNQGTQYSTATVEQVAATADMLSEQAQRLTKAVAAFSLSERHDYNQAADSATERDHNISVATADRPSLSGSVNMSASAPHALASTAGAPLLTEK